MTKLDQRLKMAAALIITGVTAQVATALWNHPLSFLAFMFVASPVTLAGTLVYLLALVRQD